MYSVVGALIVIVSFFIKESARPLFYVLFIGGWALFIYGVLKETYLGKKHVRFRREITHFLDWLATKVDTFISKYKIVLIILGVILVMWYVVK